MAQDRYSAVWVSHSTLQDFLQCPRAYFLKNVYKDPKNGHKIQVISPPLSLGAAVHEVIESLSSLPVEKRFLEPLPARFERAWTKISGKKGGFLDMETEHRYKERGLSMLKRITDNPGPIAKPAVKIREELPHFWLSDDDNIILCGKIDWLEYEPKTDSVRVIDFKSGKKTDRNESLQLPIYHLLAHYTQKRPVIGAAYWFLETNEEPEEQPLSDLVESQSKVLALAKKVKLARQLDRLACPQGDQGCKYCQPLERVLRGEADFVGEGEMKRDLYVLPGKSVEDDSVIL